MLASLRDTSHAITRLERVVAGDVGVDSAERLATEINQVPSGIEKVSNGNNDQKNPGAVCCLETRRMHAGAGAIQTQAGGSL